MDTIINQFPKEFSSLLVNNSEERIGQCITSSSFKNLGDKNNESNVCSLDGILCVRESRNLVHILDEQVLPVLQRSGKKVSSIDEQSCKDLGDSDRSPFSSSFFGKDIDSSTEPEFFELARKIGILKLAWSDTLRKFVARVSGDVLRYGNGVPYCQIICYENGDYIGMHSDWQQSLSYSGTFLVCHINLPNSAVQEQLFLYEEESLMKGRASLSKPCISLMRPPFWHQTTPLVSKPSCDEIARRWLIAICFHTK